MLQSKNARKLGDKHKWLLLVALTLVMFLINVDYTAVNLALLPLTQSFAANMQVVQWILSGYVLAWGVLVIPAGKYIETVAKKKACIFGLSLFFLASVWAGMATSIHALIMARILQGVAGAIYTPTIYALIALSFAEQEQGRAIGIISLGVGLGLAVGPFIGGLLLHWFNWRSIFLLNIPIVLGVLIMVCRSTVQEVLSNSSEKNTFFSTVRILFGYRMFVGCVFGMFIEQYGFATIVVVLGFYLQQVLLFSSLQSGYAFLFLTVIFGAIAAVGGYLADKVGLKLPIVAGFLCMVVGVLAFNWVSAGQNLWALYALFIILGAGMGLAFTGLNTALVKSIPQNFVSVGSGIFSVAALLGNVFGIGVTTFIYNAHTIVSAGIAEIMYIAFLVLMLGMISSMFAFRSLEQKLTGLNIT